MTLPGALNEENQGMALEKEVRLHHIDSPSPVQRSRDLLKITVQHRGLRGNEFGASARTGNSKRTEQVWRTPKLPEGT